MPTCIFPFCERVNTGTKLERARLRFRPLFFSLDDGGTGPKHIAFAGLARTEMETAVEFQATRTIPS
eukprot:1281129-Rhodomonas_salina.2